MNKRRRKKAATKTLAALVRLVGEPKLTSREREAVAREARKKCR
jgi:hypothetical protein